MKERGQAPRPDRRSSASTEILDPHHTYSAYIFNSAEQQQTDIAAVIKESLHLSYPVRYWWLSEAMQLAGDDPDPLIVCSHQPSADVNTGMDLYDALRAKGIKWDDLELADINEYALLGKPVRDAHALVKPTGELLFPPPNDNIQSDNIQS